MNIKWAKIIAEILLLILGGLSESAAVSKVADKYHVSKDDIYRHGGF